MILEAAIYGAVTGLVWIFSAFILHYGAEKTKEDALGWGMLIAMLWPFLVVVALIAGVILGTVEAMSYIWRKVEINETSRILRKIENRENKNE